MRVRAQPALANLLVVVVAGCGLLGGPDNPRPDDPKATAPDVPAGVATWSSLDWQDVTHEQPVRTTEEHWDQANDLAAGPGGWVAVGSNNNHMGYEGRIWHSADARSWKLANLDLLAGLDLVAIAATPDAYVALGTRSTDPNRPIATLLRSTDGLQWTEIQVVDGAWAAAVAAGDRGFAAILQADDGHDLLLSSDGISWKRAAVDGIGGSTLLADVAADGAGWLAAGSDGERAVVLRSPDGATWTEDLLPASEPVEGVLDVSAYQVVPGRWATLLLGLDRGSSCEAGDDWCPTYQAAWSWTAETGWQRLPKSTWMLGRGHGVEVHAAGEAGFLYILGDEVRTSAVGWDWTEVKETASSGAFANAVVVDGERVVAVGAPIGVDGGLTGWFGSALIRR